MRYHDITFSIAPEVLALGINGVAFAVGNLNNSTAAPAEFESMLNQSIEQIAQSWDAARRESDPILADFRRIHDAVGASRKDIASPQSLLKLIARTKKLPRINLLVDIYNFISAETRLSLGAHDLERVHGNITLRLADGAEHFLPLGSSESRPVAAGEYCYIDDANDVLCRLEVRQCDKSKVAAETHECFVMVQGNTGTDADYLKQAADRLIGLIQRFCGGEVRMLWPRG